MGQLFSNDTENRPSNQMNIHQLIRKTSEASIFHSLKIFSILADHRNCTLFVSTPYKFETKHINGKLRDVHQNYHLLFKYFHIDTEYSYVGHLGTLDVLYFLVTTKPFNLRVDFESGGVIPD